MGLITRPFNFVTGTLIKSAEVNSNEITLYTEFNGLIDDANIEDSANINATKLAGSSGTAALMRTETDPGEVGTEVLAVTIQDELRELRFAIRELKSFFKSSINYWYETVSGPVAINTLTINSLGQITSPLTVVNSLIAGNVAGQGIKVEDNGVDSIISAGVNRSTGALSFFAAGGTEAIKIYADGTVSIPNFVFSIQGCKVYATGSIAVGTSFTTIPFNNDEYDSFLMHDTISSDSRIFIPSGASGKWLFTATAGIVSILPGPGGGLSSMSFQIRFRINGTTVTLHSGGVIVGNDGLVDSVSHSEEFNLVAGDYVELQAMSPNAATVLGTVSSHPVASVKCVLSARRVA